MLPALFLYASLVNDVREFIARHDLAAAERETKAYQSQAGATSELAAAVSWIARGALEARQYGLADVQAANARKLAARLLQSTRLDDDPWLPIALGASIEVHALVLAARGERPEAVAYLREQLKLFPTTSVQERIRKDINLLSLEGKPAPPLEIGQWLGPKPVSLMALRGHPVLLFFWAHWCPDCKAEVPVLANALRVYGPHGLVLIGPTRLYGYVGGGLEAAPAVEKPYVEQVRRQFYAPLLEMPAPLSAANFQIYGASTTPTLVLIDDVGVVRFYHPGAVAGQELSARIQAVLRK